MKCTNCDGSGLVSSYEVCPVCQGLGYTGEKVEETTEEPVVEKAPKKTIKSVVKKALSKKK